MKLIVFSVCLLIGIAAVLGSSGMRSISLVTLSHNWKTDKGLRDNGKGDRIREAYGIYCGRIT
uniref:Uncharacterized protein n=1 Tax=Glossina pallidipes TaxID=7398 RepID=A0A1B0AJ15_GLOPL